MNIRIGTLLFVFSTLAACGDDPKAPSEAKFRALINAELAKDNPYCDRILWSVSGGDFTDGIRASPLQKALTKHGLLTLDPKYPKSEIWMVSASGLDLTPAGASRYSGVFQACMAEGAEVAKVVNWTEPASLFGTIASNVKYTIKPTKLAAWVTPDIESLLPQLHEEKERTLGMILTAKGWQKAM